MEFRKLGSTKEVKQKFNQKITFKKYGKEICIHDFIQEDKDAVDIYTNLEIYGSVKPVKVNVTEIVQDLTGAHDLRSLEEQRKKIIEIWENLPLKEREKFNNNVSNFIDNGYDYFLNLEKQIIEKQKETTQEQNQNKGEEEENEQE